MLRKSIPTADEIHFNGNLILKYTNDIITVYLNPEVKNKCFRVIKHDIRTFTTLYIDELEIFLTVNGENYDEIAKIVLFHDYTNEMIEIADNLYILDRNISIDDQI